jgi:hypothetical protein
MAGGAAVVARGRGAADDGDESRLWRTRVGGFDGLVAGQPALGKAAPEEAWAAGAQIDPCLRVAGAREGGT